MHVELIIRNFRCKIRVVVVNMYVTVIVTSKKQNRFTLYENRLINCLTFLPSRKFIPVIYKYMYVQNKLFIPFMIWQKDVLYLKE